MTVALVLGAAVRADGTASPTLALRTHHAIGLWRAGRVEAICFTGGLGRHGPPEAHVARDIARAAGVPAEAIMVEDRSTSTLQNIAFARDMLPEGAPLLLVSNRWHLPRAWIIATVLGASASTSGPVGQASWPATLRAILREGAALPASLFRAMALRKT